VGASGAIYALRRRLFRPIAASTILDDVLIPMNVVRQGYRVVFEPRARAFDRVAASAQAEFRRKVRTIAGNFQLFLREPWLLNPWANPLWFRTLSHKACRLLSPLCLAAVFASSVALMGEALYRVLFAAQLLFYAAAGLGYAAQARGFKSRLLHVPCAFCLLNWATVVALLRFAQGRQQVTWQKTSG
jgi:cellulose synthase/poly-beta-1,6-N-acetylglucosamine synthase-like glycosyltransferase